MDLLTDGTPAHRDTQNPRRLALTDPLIQLEAIRRIVRAAGCQGTDLVGDVAGLATARMLSKWFEGHESEVNSIQGGTR